LQVFNDPAALTIERSACGAMGHAGMDAFKVLHILSMFAAVTFLVGEALLYALAIWRSDVAGLAAVRRLLGGRPLLGVAFFVAGIVFGLLTAMTGGFEFFAGWLIAAYVLIVALFLVNGSPPVQRLPRIGAEAMEGSGRTAVA
jgi:Mn2+/Fe2+ NRAMP family transporter